MRMMNKKYKLVVFREDGEYVIPEKFVSDTVDGIVDKLASLSKTMWIFYPFHAIVDSISNIIVDLTDEFSQDLSLEENVRTVDDYSKWLKENSSTLQQIKI